MPSSSSPTHSSHPAHPAISIPFTSLTSPLSSFDPDAVQRITFRWTRAMVIEREHLVEGSYSLGPDFHPQGRYVFESDYRHLLELYHELLAKLK